MEKIKDTLSSVVPATIGGAYGGITFNSMVEVALYALIGATVGYFAKMAYDYLFKKK